MPPVSLTAVVTGPGAGMAIIPPSPAILCSGPGESGENTPISGPVSLFGILDIVGKLRNAHPFSSCGKYAFLLPQLPKYGRNAPRPRVAKGL